MVVRPKVQMDHDLFYNADIRFGILECAATFFIRFHRDDEPVSV